MDEATERQRAIASRAATVTENVSEELSQTGQTVEGLRDANKRFDAAIKNMTVRMTQTVVGMVASGKQFPSM